ncbi:MAG: hypothetical protein HYY25_01100 [Candidatus Wallbacteria bacterium]|nr:hypothetical protein [Candidatus Wallbacteria bacterium]
MNALDWNGIRERAAGSQFVVETRQLLSSFTHWSAGRWLAELGAVVLLFNLAALSPPVHWIVGVVLYCMMGGLAVISAMMLLHGLFVVVPNLHWLDDLHWLLTGRKRVT